MTRSTILTTVSGRMVDLLSPQVGDIDFIGDIAEQLAKENRYNGATRGVTYSVAQHLVEGIAGIRRETDEHAAIAWWLLHDAPEAYLKDDTTPKKRALAALAEESFGVLGSQITATFDALTERWDRAITEAAGLEWPCPPAIVEVVHRVDKTMLVTEWRDLMKHPAPFETEGVVPLFGTLVPWDWRYARGALAEAFATHLPALNGVRTA